MTWKQPIDISIKDNPNIDTLSRLLYFEILAWCRNEDGIESFIHNNRFYQVKLKRGQMIFKLTKYAKELKLDHKRITRCISIINDFFTKLECQAKPYGLIITVLNYDNLVKMERQRKVKGISRESQGKPKEIDKSEKTAESDLFETEIEKYPSLQSDSFLFAWSDWEHFRSEKKKPLTPKSIKEQIRFLSEQPDPVECIRQSIRNGYQGIFKIKGNNNNGNHLEEIPDKVKEWLERE